jgi:molybdate transport system substrate-binding protein
MSCAASLGAKRARRRRRFLAGVLALTAAGFSDAPSRAADGPLVAAAADLQYALSEIAGLFGEETGQTVRIAFGSSGNFRRQITQGAPFELYLSADEGYVRALSEKGFTVGDGAVYAMGRVVIFAPHGSPLIPDAGLRNLEAALADGKLKRFAIANPDHAPYGRAAREVLMKAGLWERLEDRLVVGENAAQAVRFAASGSAQGGIIPYSLSLAPSVSAHGTFALVPEDWHRPLRQRMVLLKNAGEAARRFYAFIQSPAAREVFERHGFMLPKEPS